MSIIQTERPTDVVAQCCKVIVSGSEVKSYSLQGPIALSKIHELARLQHINSYTVVGGSPLKEIAESEFPFNGDVVVREHNEAKSVI